jgi:hypothetical protein
MAVFSFFSPLFLLFFVLTVSVIFVMPKVSYIQLAYLQLKIVALWTVDSYYVQS